MISPLLRIANLGFALAIFPLIQSCVWDNRVVMKMGVSWTLKGELAERTRRHQLKLIAYLALRMSLLTLVAGYGFWLLALWHLNTPMPHQVIDLVHWLLIGHAVVWWVLIVPVFSKSRYSLTRFGNGDKRWTNWLGYSVEVNPISEQHFVLKLWNKDRLQAKTLPLPEDPRLQRLILRYVARFLPGLETHDDEEAIRKDPPKAPAWFIPLTLALTAGHGVLLGGVMYLLKTRWGWIGDVTQLIWLLGSLMHLAWVPACLLARTERYRRIGARLKAVAGAMSMLALLVAIITFFLLIY